MEASDVVAVVAGVPVEAAAGLNDRDTWVEAFPCVCILSCHPDHGTEGRSSKALELVRTLS